MEIVMFSLFNGVLYGLLLFMLASGLTLVFSMMGVLNFAHASFYMLGAYLGFEIGRATNFYIALCVVPVLVGALGMVVERYGLRRAHAYGHVGELMFTFGLAHVVQEVVVTIWGRAPLPTHIPPSLDFALFRLHGLDYSAYRFLMLALSVGIFASLFLLFARTRLGLVLRAATTHPDTLAGLGHNVTLVFALVFGLGTALAALAGVLAGNVLGTEPAMALHLGSIIFVVIVVGGLGSLTGTLIASLTIGILQTVASSFDVSISTLLQPLGMQPHWPQMAVELTTTTLSRLAPLVPFLLMIILLIVRPGGLMGRPTN
jgi:branched-chain amino acid transport system permease protein